MRLGLSSYTYTWAVGVPGSLPPVMLTALGLLERAASLGVHVVQIADNLALDRLPEPELDALQDFAQRSAMQIEMGTRGIDRAHLRRYLGLALRFGSPLLRVVVDTPVYHPSPDETAEMLLPLRAEFERAGVRLAIENHDRFSAAELAGVVRRLGDWAGVCLDTVNSFGAMEGPRQVVAVLGPLVVNLHVKDFSIARASHQMGFSIEGRPAGQGRLEVPWLLRELGRMGRDHDGNLSAIIELWTPPEGAIGDTLAKEARWAAESVDYLRRFIEA
jgi:3-oxoisoapionate decarboxylase